MDEPNKAPEPGGSPLQGPHWHRASAFVPLRLVLTPGGHKLDLDRPNMVVGRHTGADIRLPLPDVSRQHCRFAFADGRWQVVDLDSTNGIYVNGSRVRSKELRHRDRVAIGSFTFEVDLGPDAESAAESDVAGEVLHRIAERLTAPPADQRPAA
jgi:pSer/pThr/pTyr-binding forkhead associated (FHA) protein